MPGQMQTAYIIESGQTSVTSHKDSQVLNMRYKNSWQGSHQGTKHRAAFQELSSMGAIVFIPALLLPGPMKGVRERRGLAFRSFLPHQGSLAFARGKVRVGNTTCPFFFFFKCVQP